ncbi:hypothetical protein M422DRAFT_49072 [Sphaerobolus stellatus SS14]|uniref:Unplaced genomic scaffold SPHSTscaffold_68, whole genome shotgun sequence n=1 Tax=Sphaerobolus stellatus (strain SS14) TaxID=990650 RepID=A0A0C9VRB9_SPHS4|nr:hypothetical protein M422DRAFT_49072 [Sphaerobolus stellatus SS14]
MSASNRFSDTAASVHLTNNRSHFSEYWAIPSEVDGIFPGMALQIEGIGTVSLQLKVGNKVHTVKLTNVKYALDTPNNLLSIGRLTDGVKFKSPNEVIFAKGQKIGHMYQMWAKVQLRNKSCDFIAAAKGHILDFGIGI